MGGARTSWNPQERAGPHVSPQCLQPWRKGCPLGEAGNLGPILLVFLSDRVFVFLSDAECGFFSLGGPPWASGALYVLVIVNISAVVTPQHAVSVGPTALISS